MHPTSAINPAQSVLPQSREATLVFLDVIESVRLIEHAEAAVIGRWMALVETIRSEILPRFGGRLAKSSGDGLILEFDAVHEAVSASLRIKKAIGDAHAEASASGAERLALRMSIATGEVYHGPTDIYGRTVNLGSRLLSLAGPDEIIASESTRNRISDGLDADLHDLGACYLRHLPDPVRAWRIGPPAGSFAIPGPPAVDPRPTIAVMPFQPRAAGGGAEEDMVGEVLAEIAIRTLSAFSSLNVISRLSTAALAGRTMSVRELGAALSADYVVNGTYRSSDGRLDVMVELADARSGAVLWSDGLSGRPDEIYGSSAEFIAALAGRVTHGIAMHELAKSRRAPMPSLSASTMLLSAVTLLHRLSHEDFARARELLEALIERSPRQALPLAWLACWHVMNVEQGWTVNSKRDAALATDLSDRALDADPDCPLALTMSGSVNTYLLHDPVTGEARYDAAIAINPSEPMAWLLRSAACSFSGRGREAVENAHRALRLSPFDPHRYLYDSLAASAHLVAGDDEEALIFAEKSARANRLHASTLRVKAAAEWRLGRFDAAHRTAAELMRLAPSFTTRGYDRLAPIADPAVRGMMIEALRGAGVPD